MSVFSFAFGIRRNNKKDSSFGKLLHVKFGITVILCYCCLDAMFRHYPEILQALFFLLERENEVRVVDNICAAVCRMICTNISKIPMEQV